MRSVSLAAFCLAASAGMATSSEIARFQFCWIGAAGFTMEGIIGFPAEQLGTGLQFPEALLDQAEELKAKLPPLNL